jgi:succinyl-diaminopimelate desuccinylase
LERTISREFESWIKSRREELADNLLTLIRIPSISDKTSPVKPYGEYCIVALKKALEMAEGFGFKVENYENYLGCVSFPNEDPARKTIGLWGHLDVVPAGNNWTFNPFEGIYQDGFVIGRGAKDNKGPALSSLYLLRFLKEAGIDLGCNIRLYLACDEESGMTDLDYFNKHYKAPDLSLVPDTQFPLCFAEKGILEATLACDTAFSDEIIDFNAGTVTNIVPDVAVIHLKKTPKLLDAIKELPESFEVSVGNEITVTAHGQARHTARPEGGVNAARLICDALVKLGALSESDAKALAFMAKVNEDFYGTGLDIGASDEISGKLTCVGSITRVRDRKPTLTINIRYPVFGKSDELWAKIQQECKKSGFTAEFLRDSKPNYFPPEDPVVGAVMSTFREMTGDESKPYVMAGGTYARMLPRAFAFGMGFNFEKNLPDFYKDGMGNAHEANEFVSIDSLVTAMSIYSECLKSIAKVL